MMCEISEMWPLGQGEIYPAEDDIWEVFMLDDETAEPEPMPGDFYGEVDAQEEV